MSFFGFDPAGKPGADAAKDYDDFEDDDRFNDETFGADASAGIGQDFAFGQPGQPSQPKSTLQPAQVPQKPTKSYASAVEEVLQPMASLWADEAPQTEDKVLSMQEIQSKLQPQQPAPMPMFPPHVLQALYSPQVQQQMMQAVAQGRFPNMEMATQGMISMLMTQPHPMFMPPMGMMPPPPGFNPMQQQQPQQPSAQQPVQQQQQVQQPQTMQQQQQPAVPVQAPVQTPVQTPAAVAPQTAVSGSSLPSQKIDLTAMPSLADAKSGTAQAATQSREQQPLQPQSQVFQQQQRRQHSSYQQRQVQQQQQLQQQMEQMTPEEREKFIKRQQKVSKITRASGFMTPKDKDFVTRFQLSQIVTEDPYNEDFYSQVYKILNSAIDENDMNSLAQKYLDQSGHRLGGRSKRADIALQRMQQQVSKAVSVAKERGERKGVLTKEGALGKVSVGSGKTPRKQLTVNKEEESADDNLPREYSFDKSSKSFQLSIIEKIYKEVLKLESSERENVNVDSSDLWKSLHLNDIIKTSNGEKISPFISILSVNKTMKLFSRMFHFFSQEEKAQLTTLIFTNLEKLDIIFKGSYKNYDLMAPPKEVQNKIELFEETIFKSLVYYLSDSDFHTVLSMIQSLITNNNLLVICSTKIGLQLITVLVSRLELIKQDYSSVLSQTEISQWNTTYDFMFQQLEGRLDSLFPPYLSYKEGSNRVDDIDDSYIWQFLASITLAGQLNHQSTIVGELRDEIFGVQSMALSLKQAGNVDKYDILLENLNLFLNVMGLCANENDISELE